MTHIFSIHFTTATAIVAEDDVTNLELLSELLELNGIQTLDKVNDGKMAVASFESLKPDVVFLDVIVSEYDDGLYALKYIHNIDPSADV